jgi:hypothetical protein
LRIIDKMLKENNEDRNEIRKEKTTDWLDV